MDILKKLSKLHATMDCVFDLPPPALDLTRVRDSAHAPTGQKIHTSEPEMLVCRHLLHPPPGRGEETVQVHELAGQVAHHEMHSADADVV